VSHLALFNRGNQDLQITGINLESPGSDFSFTEQSRTYLIPAGSSLNLDVCFTPISSGTRSNALLILNNSLNSPQYRIDLQGIGIDASTSFPSNLQLQVQGYDMRLRWNPVISDNLGNPFSPSGYLVFGSTRADVPLDDYLLISYSDQPEFLHRQIARINPRMFYMVVALDEDSRHRCASLFDNPERNAMSWKDLRELLQIND